MLTFRRSQCAQQSSTHITCVSSAALHLCVTLDKSEGRCSQGCFMQQGPLNNIRQRYAHLWVGIALILNLPLKIPMLTIETYALLSHCPLALHQKQSAYAVHFALES